MSEGQVSAGFWVVLGVGDEVGQKVGCTADRNIEQIIDLIISL